MKALLKVKNLTKPQVLECFDEAFEYKQQRSGEVYCWYYAKKYLEEDLQHALKRAKELYGIVIEYEISTNKEEQL